MPLLREFQPADAKQVFALHERALEATGAFTKRGPWDHDLENIEEIYVRPGGCFYVIEEANAIIAMGALKRHAKGEGEIKRMRVAPEKQRQGLGQQLLNVLLETAKERGILKIILDTTNQQSAAQKFYVKNGFRETRREKLRTMTVIYYERIIPTSPRS